MNQTDELLRSLRSVRRYSAEPIADDVLGAILEDARWTGSSKNTQPWELVVVRDPATLRKLAGCGPYAGHLAGARAAIVLVMEHVQAQFDAGRLAQAIMTAAWGYGVGSCIGSLYPEANAQRAHELLGIPAERSAHTAIALGYPDSPAARTVASGPANVRASVTPGRKSLRDFVSWERYGSRERSAAG